MAAASSLGVGEKSKKPPGVWDPAACGSSCCDRSLGGLRPEVWETQQFERVGVPLGEEVVHFRVAWLSLAKLSFASAVR